MAKKSTRSVSRFERDEYGCIRGLISMLDFRHGCVSQKMLPDRKHGSKRVLSKLETPKDCSEINSDKDSEAARDDTAKLSVKELMEEEMIGDQTQKKNASSADEEPQEVISTNAVYAKKKRRRMKKKSFDLGDAEESVSMSIASAKHKASKSLDLTLMMEELCSQVPMEHGNHPTQDADSDSVRQPTLDSSVIEQQLGEVAKVFMDHFSNEKSFTKDGKIRPSKELLDALHVLNSNKETFMKLLQDPDSQLLLHLKKLQDSRVRKDENSQQLLEQVLDTDKQDSFFWRTFKGLERSLSKRNDICQDSNKIVVLKPGTPNSNNLETHSNGLIERGSSNFSFSEFRRRLKLAVVKGLPDSRDVEKTVGGENVLSPRSPRKDHFFIEKAPRPPSNLKKGEYKGKPIDGEAMTENANSFAADQRESNIYVEARKHLAEIVGNGDVDLEFLGRQVPKSLGRILSFPDCNSPICSPRQGGSPGFAAIQRRPSSFHESQRAEEDICHQAQEIYTRTEDSANRQTEGQASLNQCSEGEPSVKEEKLVDEKSQLNHHNAPVSSLSSREEDSVVATEVSRSSDTEIEERSHRLNSSSVLCSSFSNGDVEVVNSLHEFEEIERALELDALEVSSSSASQSGSSPIKVIIKGLDGTIDPVNQASPDSVLVPLYEEEDDISPPVTKSLPGAAIVPIQPRQIQFEEQILPFLDQFAYINTCGEDKKSMFEFVKAVVQKSCLTWYELLRRSLLSDCILDPSIFDELECLQDRLCDDPKLIFDLIDKTLVETRLHCLGPTLSSGMSFISSEFKGKDIFAEIWKGVEWYFRIDGLPRTLDQVLALDYRKDQQWSDLRPDTEGIGIEIEESILEELIEETISDCMICDKKNESMVLPLESVDSE